MDNIRDLTDKIDFIEGDIRDEKTAARAVDGVLNVLHLAALPSVPRSVSDPVTTNEVNVLGTLRMLVAARDGGVERFVFSSSSSVYGNTPVLPKHEDMTPGPLSPYAVHKITGEYYCGIFRSLYGLKTYILRYFNVFGPRQNPKSQYAAVIPKFIDMLNRGDAPTVYGDGEQTRDFTFVDNVVSANLKCCSAPDGAEGGVYNIAGGKRVSLNELIEKLQKIMGSDIKPIYSDPRAGDVRDSLADVKRAKDILGYKTVVDFDEGLRKTVIYFLNA